jgi:hypothetical protein
LIFDGLIVEFLFTRGFFFFDCDLMSLIGIGDVKNDFENLPSSSRLRMPSKGSLCCFSGDFRTLGLLILASEH